MSEPALIANDVVRTFKTGEKSLTVLNGVGFTLAPGEIVGLIGPSGSGKSSLLHVCGLLERPTAGQVLISGRDAWKLPDRDRTALRRQRIGFIYQFHLLLPEFSALDNVAMPQLIAGVPHRKARAEAERLLTALGLAERLTHAPAQLSGGEQQRVAIARALANRPRVLLADEPTGNLDPATSGAVFQSLFAIARQEGVAALIATHNHELAGHMDRVMVLRDGRLEARAPS